VCGDAERDPLTEPLAGAISYFLLWNEKRTKLMLAQAVRLPATRRAGLSFPALRCPFRFSKIDRDRCRAHRPLERTFLAPTFTGRLQNEESNRPYR
jgi:hypothetical protein